MAPVDLLPRRAWPGRAALGVTGASLSGWLGPLAAATAADPRRRRCCILLWMAGGPSQTDTFDLKPGHANGGPFREIAPPPPRPPTPAPPPPPAPPLPTPPP